MLKQEDLRFKATLSSIVRLSPQTKIEQMLKKIVNCDIYLLQSSYCIRDDWLVEQQNNVLFCCIGPSLADVEHQWRTKARTGSKSSLVSG